MKKDQYQPGLPAEAELRPAGPLWTLVFVRELAHPPQRVWRALTDPAELREWAPFDANRDLGRPGAGILTMAGGPAPEELPTTVRLAKAPTLLEYTWGTDVLRWELEPTQRGTRLTLSHTLDDRAWAPKVAAGWHICLDVAERFLSGKPIGRIVADEAKRHGWERLNAGYAQRLGVPDTGWPLPSSTE